MRANKVFIGQFLRDLRSEHALTQAKFGEKLGISTSYLNQLENNQRHVTATVLMALAEQFSVDIASISKQDSDRLLADLMECFADPVFKGKTPSSHELRLTAQNSPGVARSLITMQQALRRTSDQLVELDDSISRSGSLSEPTPYEEVRDFFHFINNYLHDLDLKAEQLAATLDTETRSSYQALIDYIKKQHGIEVVEQNTDQHSIRDYEQSQQLLKLNRRSSQATRSFHIAHQIALIEHLQIIDDHIAKAEFRSSEAALICRIGIANYFAGATLMPYTNFHTAAKELRHDLVHLADRFESSIEQVAHRLSTLQRPGLSGIPIFFARVDRAGNITKRHSATKLQFARFGSGCPLWNAHKAFESPGEIIRQLAETPDGERYLCLACTVDKSMGGYKDPTRHYALALGCEVRYMDQFVYSEHMDTQAADAFEPIGISCRICDRENCQQRAMPPLKSKLEISTDIRRIVPYSLKTQ